MAGGGAGAALAPTPGGRAMRAELAPLVADLAALEADRRRAIVDAGLVMPHWPIAVGPGRRRSGTGGHRRGDGDAGLIDPISA